MRDVLIVEDEEDIAHLLLFSLRGADYQVRWARTGEEALERAKQETPDLVLLDVMLPGIPGWNVCEALRANEETRDVPIVFLTARTGADDLRRGLLAGGTAYLLKPFDPVSLRDTLDRLLAKGSSEN